MSAIRRVSPRPTGIPTASSITIQKNLIKTSTVNDEGVPNINGEGIKENSGKLENQSNDDNRKDSIVSGVIDNTDEDEEAIKFNKKMKKIRHAKVLAYLDTLAEQKRREEADQSKAEVCIYLRVWACILENNADRVSKLK